MSVGDRIVLGEGYGLARAPRGSPYRVELVGLAERPESAALIPLDFPGTKLSPIVGGQIVAPESRRKFRLVLEVIEEAAVPVELPLPEVTLGGCSLVPTEVIE